MSLKLTDYQKSRIIESNKTRVYSKATLKKISLINKGRKWSKAVRKRMSLGSMGKILSNETKKKISLKVKGKKTQCLAKLMPAAARRKRPTLTRIGRIPWNKGITA